MAELVVSFITYTKGAVQYVTSPVWENQFLDWLNSVDSSQGYERRTYTNVGIKCAPMTVHATEKREATILKLVDKEGA